MKKNAWAPKKTEKGFSLVEFMLVIVILGLLVAVAVPVWDAFVSGSNLKAAVRQVATDIRDIQGEAMAELKYYGIVFDEGLNTYHIYSSTDKATLFTAAAPVGKTLSDGATFSRSGGDPVTFLNNRLIFNKDGSADVVNPEESIYLQNDKGRERFITVAATGKATVN
ncbi:MAG: type II secretion system protein [Actinomycetota bacterium]|nr:type II secretion system protein [Actinomycetota bacterium]